MQDSKEKSNGKQVRIEKTKFDAIVFDLDGVVTDTAGLHARVWKLLFDTYLENRAKTIAADSRLDENDPFRPFDLNADYLPYVDGKPRYDGVDSFLRSRGIELPRGNPSDSEDQETVCGLGNRKNNIFKVKLETEGVEVFQSTVNLILSARKIGIKTGIISSSKNCVPVLKTVGLLDLFDVKVDGIDAVEQKLNGKPAADVFIAAARQLSIPPERAIVVEDAISGVQSGHAGGFGLVIGVDRTGISDDLLANGADVVVQDLEEVIIVE